MSSTSLSLRRLAAEPLGDLGSATPPDESYPPLNRLGLIADRRTAALIGPDGSLRWLCLPNYDGTAVFGALLDAERGGYWQLGPLGRSDGGQRYLDNSNVLVTTWADADAEIELIDAMPWPADDRAPEKERRRVVLRHLRCRRGTAACAMHLQPRDADGQGPSVTAVTGGLEFKIAGCALGLWTSRPAIPVTGGASAEFTLEEGEEFWAMLGMGENPAAWSAQEAEIAVQETLRYWRDWCGKHHYDGDRRQAVIRSALVIESMSFAPTGALVAAPTASLPERIGGDRNYDYRYAWIRDASLALATLAVLGNLENAERYLEWLSGLGSSSAMPVQVLYRIDGGTNVSEHSRDGISGYRGSRPVRFGNHASRQRQIDSLGYLADCAAIYLKLGGRWKPEYWRLIKRLADYTVAHWHEPGNGIWELSAHCHYVSSKVMAWATLKRALDFAERSGDSANFARWRSTMMDIHAEVMARGWSGELQAFRQHYGADTLDASALLIPLMGFLSPNHPRVVATVERIEQKLMLGGLVYRFRPEETIGRGALPMGQFEGAFLPCCFWLAAVYALMGRNDDADALLRRTEALAGTVGLFSEEADGLSHTALGNIPMIFSHAEYARAILQRAGAWPRDL